MLDGFLGLAPCPQGLKNESYSFANELLNYSKQNQFIAQDQPFFKSMQWILNRPLNNTGDSFYMNGQILFNFPKEELNQTYLEIGEPIMTFGKHFKEIVFDDKDIKPKEGAIFTYSFELG